MEYLYCIFYATIIIVSHIASRSWPHVFSHILCFTVDSLKGILALYQTHRHSLASITTGTQRFPKRVLHTARSSASSSNFQYYVLSLISSSICLRFLPPLPVTSILPSISFSVTPFTMLTVCS
jgi:hypothetical protein